MAITINPTFRNVVSGSGISLSDSSFSFILGQKVEETYTITNVSSPIILNLTNIIKPKLLVIYSDGNPFNIVLTQGSNIITLVNDGTSGPTILPVDATFISGLTSIGITALATTATVISINAYGTV